VDAHHTGAPVMRAMMLEFPCDPGCDALDRQYLLGDRLLVAPVFSADGVVDYYVPAGRWTNLLTGEVVAGPGWHRGEFDFFTMPLLVRPGSLLAIGACSAQPDYDYADGVTFRVYELEDGAVADVQVPLADGSCAGTASVRRSGDSYHIAVSGEIRNWKLEIAGAGYAAVVDGDGEVTKTELGVTIGAPAGCSELHVRTD